MDIDDDPSEDVEELPPQLPWIAGSKEVDRIDNGFGLLGVAIAAAAACNALGAILTRYDLALGPKPSKMVGPSFSCFLKCRSRFVC